VKLTKKRLPEEGEKELEEEKSRRKSVMCPISKKTEEEDEKESKSPSTVVLFHLDESQTRKQKNCR